MKLNLGCGPVQPSGWVNVDGSNRAFLASKFPFINKLLVNLGLVPPTEFNSNTFYTNLSRFPLPWKQSSIEVIYMGEFLEHLTKEQGANLIEECYRILQLGGILRIRVPDSAKFWNNYLKEYNETRCQPRETWSNNHERWIKMCFDELCVSHPRPWQFMGHFHKWMYDDISLILLLEKKGFIDVDRLPYHQSRIEEIEAVEVREDLIVEAVHP